jgi:hypothetical protein
MTTILMRAERAILFVRKERGRFARSAQVLRRRKACRLRMTGEGMIELESMAVEMPEVEGHPNRAEFRGVLTVVDVASQRAPSGSGGRRVVLTRKAAEAALPSLLGMALDYAPTYDRHDQRRKVGVITSAEIVGRELEVGGYLYGKDFPDVVEQVAREGRRPVMRAAGAPTLSPQKARRQGWGNLVSFEAKSPLLAKAARSRAPILASVSACTGSRMRSELAAAVERLRELTAGVRGRKIATLRAGIDTEARGVTGLGMSFEVANVTLADRRSRVWTLTKVMFTGAAILRRNRAAYEDTWIELV